MTSRRAVLAGVGAVGIGGLAGCTGLPFVEEEDDEPAEVSLPSDAVTAVAWPDSPFPVGIPPSLADAHAERARALLAEVPSDPSVPNAAIAEELRSDRRQVADRLDVDPGRPWPTHELSEWRGRRESTATVRGAWRAATGKDDGAVVADRRQTVREELAAFVADHEYRAPSPREAVLAHAPIEALVAGCRRRTRPIHTYPADPVADPFGAGEAVGRVELARAVLADARGLRDVYLGERDDPSSQWADLIETSERLRYAVGTTRLSVEDFLGHDEPPFEADLDGTPARWLFDLATRQVELMTEDHDAYRDDGDYARAVIEAGRTLAAIEALREAIEAIRDGAYQDEVSVDSVTRADERAQEAIGAIDTGEYPRLATQIGRPAIETVDGLPTYIEDGYADAIRVEGQLGWVELFAQAVPAATAFVLERLR